MKRKNKIESIVNDLDTLSVLTAKANIKPICTTAHSGSIISTRNGTQKNILKFGTTKEIRLIQLWIDLQYDFEELKDILAKCSKE